MEIQKMDKSYTDEQVQQWLAEERELEEAIETGDWRPLPAEEEAMMRQKLSAAAKNYNAKKRINIRLPEADIIALKKRAEREGLPYQTMIAGILHKVATGIWDEEKNR
ncbi:MAG: antitoxin [Bdellovibrionales bacterium]